MLDQRGQLLRAALGFAGLPRPSYDRALWALRTWLDSWSGIRRIAVGMARQGYDLQLTRYDARGWRATFYTAGIEHSITSATAGTLTPYDMSPPASTNSLTPNMAGSRFFTATGRRNHRPHPRDHQPPFGLPYEGPNIRRPQA